jgi:hypothetical protein
MSNREQGNGTWQRPPISPEIQSHPAIFKKYSMSPRLQNPLSISPPPIGKTPAARYRRVFPAHPVDIAAIWVATFGDIGEIEVIVRARAQCKHQCN